MYNYGEQKKEIFTEEGVEMFIAIRDNVRALLRSAGAVRTDCALSSVIGDSWTMLACMDRLVELGEIIEITQVGVRTQNRVFISPLN